MAVSSALVVNFVLQNYILPTVADETATRGVFWSKYKKILTIPPPGNIFWSKFGAKNCCLGTFETLNCRMLGIFNVSFSVNSNHNNILGHLKIHRSLEFIEFSE